MRFGHRPAPAPHDGPLDEVLEAERAGAETIAAARRDAEAWLAIEKAAIERDTNAELAALDRGHAAGIDAAERDAASRAAELVAAAEQYARELQALDDKDLLPIVARYVAAILPGGEP